MKKLSPFICLISALLAAGCHSDSPSSSVKEAAAPTIDMKLFF